MDSRSLPVGLPAAFRISALIHSCRHYNTVPKQRSPGLEKNALVEKSSEEFREDSVLPERIFAIIERVELRYYTFLAPNFLSSLLGAFLEMLIALCEITVDRLFALLNCLIIAVMDDCPSHPAKNRFDD